MRCASEISSNVIVFYLYICSSFVTKSSITMLVIFLSDFSEEESAQVLASNLHRHGARIVTRPEHDELVIPSWLAGDKAQIMLDQSSISPRLIFENLTRSEVMTLACFNLIPNVTVRKTEKASF